MRNGHFVQKGFALGIHRYASLKCAVRGARAAVRSSTKFATLCRFRYPRAERPCLLPPRKEPPLRLLLSPSLFAGRGFLSPLKILVSGTKNERGTLVN